MSSLLIQNATIATSAKVLRGDLLVEDGKIAALKEHIAPPDGAHIIDASEKMLLPGGVDAHTHFDLDVGFTRASDNFYSGSVAAAIGGTTTIIDHMAFGPQNCELGHQAKVYHSLAQDTVIDYGFHGVIQHVNPQVLADMETLLLDEGISSFKIYLTYDYMLQDEDVLKVLNRAQQLGIVICAHCENHEMVTSLRQQFIDEGKLSTLYHPLSRPPQSEEEAIFRFLRLAKDANQAKVYVVHLTTGIGLEAIRQVRQTGQKNIYAETCPQYLVLDDHLYENPVEGLKYIMSPPLRKVADEGALWQGLAANDIDTVGTDHCPFFFATQKQRGAQNFTLCPNGAPGVELRMSIMFSEGYKKGRITLPQLVQSCCTRPAEIFGIAPQKGDICVGADADLVLFDPDINWTVTKNKLHENVDYTPYEGMALQGAPVLTISRGEIIAQNGNFTGQKGRGRYLKRHVGN